MVQALLPQPSPEPIALEPTRALPERPAPESTPPESGEAAAHEPAAHEPGAQVPLPRVSSVEVAAPPAEMAGACRLVPAAELDRAELDLDADEALVVSLTCQEIHPGALGDHVDEAIEGALATRGQGARGMAAMQCADASLSNQLFRARRLGFRGLGIVLRSMRTLAAPLGGLHPDDASTLRFYARAAEERPLVMVMAEEDASVGAFVETVTLESLLRGASVPRAETTEPTTMVEVSVEITAPDAAAAPVDEEAPVEAAVEAPVEATSAPTTEESCATTATTAAVTATPVDETAAPALAPPADDDEPAPSTDATSFTPSLAVATVIAPSPEPPAVEAHGARAAEVLPVQRPHDPTHGAWRAWVIALAAARGPQPLSAFERLFAQSYLPLSRAIAEGLEEPRAIATRDEFRRTFARAYSEALPTFALTGKRPKMVLDAHDVAAKMARLHGARGTHLLLCDAMRFDVGARVADRIATILSGRASLVDRVTLFASLPSITSRQLDGLARGVESLRAPIESEREADPIRGRTAEVVRRVKLGSRDVSKLDVIEARLRQAGADAARDLPDIEEDCAQAIARHSLALPERTMLFVFGDHGFSLDDEGAMGQGGASPEEVIVAGYGFLVGALH